MLSTLQNKLTLSFIENEISMTQNKRNDFKNLSFSFSIYTSNVVKIVVDETSFVNIKKQILNDFASMFQLTNVAMIISRKNVKIMSKNLYEKSQKSMKFLIKKFQTNDIWTQKFCDKKNALFKRRRRSKIWFVNFEKLVRNNERLYVFENAIVRKKLINKNHDDFLIEHFDFEKIFDFLQKKYYWIDCDKQTNEYVKICDICQRIKTFRHKSYDEFVFLSISKNFWKKIIMNFVIDLSSNKREKIVYDSIFVIMNRCTKMIRYIFITMKFDVVELTKIFFIEIILRFDMFENIMNDKNFVFINAFWSILCYHSKIKRRLNIVFHFQTNDLIERQNQILKHYLRIFVDDEQTQWTNHLSLIEFVYNNVRHNITEKFFYFILCMIIIQKFNMKLKTISSWRKYQLSKTELNDYMKWKIFWRSDSKTLLHSKRSIIIENINLCFMQLTIWLCCLSKILIKNVSTRNCFINSLIFLKWRIR